MWSVRSRMHVRRVLAVCNYIECRRCLSGSWKITLNQRPLDNLRLIVNRIDVIGVRGAWKPVINVISNTLLLYSNMNFTIRVNMLSTFIANRIRGNVCVWFSGYQSVMFCLNYKKVYYIPLIQLLELYLLIDDSHLLFALCFRTSSTFKLESKTNLEWID